MTNAIADTVSRTPMSPNLVGSLARAAEFATARENREVKVEHLLLAFLEDPDASIILGSSNIDLAKLGSTVAVHLDQIPPEPPRELSVSAELSRILTAAAAAAQQGRRSEINGAIVLAAIIGDGKTEAAHLLKLRGLTFDAAIRALQRAASASPPTLPAAPLAADSPARATGAVDDILASARERLLSRASSTTTEAAASPPEASVAAPAEPPAAVAQEPAPEPASRPSPAPLPPGEPVRRPPGRRWALDQPAAATDAPIADLGLIEARNGGARTVVVEAAALAVAVARSPKVSRPATVEARVPKASIRAFVDGAQGRTEIDVPKALAVRLRGREGDFWVEMSSAETVWIEATGGFQSDEFAHWRWTVTPRSRGRKRLQLIASARAITGDGLVTQVALPDQTVEIRVGGGVGRPLKRAAGWAVAALVGGLIAAFGGPVFEAALPWVEKVIARL